MCSFNMSAMGLKPIPVGGSTSKRFNVPYIYMSGELQEVLRTTFEPTKTFLKVLELLLEVLEMLLDVLDLSWMSWTCPGGTRMVRMATILPS